MAAFGIGTAGEGSARRGSDLAFVHHFFSAQPDRIDAALQDVGTAVGGGEIGVFIWVVDHEIRVRTRFDAALGGINPQTLGRVFAGHLYHCGQGDPALFPEF